ncbi:MAG: peptidylprolyl cis-trans isomerase, PpiC-type [Myxococcales bacterium]|nr:peptidylprolyl cis-trans isomerase, PpiC-type [Myxococcales bacterium]
MRVVALLFPCAVGLCAVGCRGGASDEPSAALVAESKDAVIATVDGRPIYAAAVAAQARARGVDARAALEDLIQAEALAGEAARRGLDRDTEVRLETRGALARRYLQESFERDVTIDDVPEAPLRREYQRQLPYLNHSTYADVWHFFVPVGKKATPEEKAAARSRVEALAKKARGLSLEDFKKLARDEGLQNEEIVTARDGWVQKPFSYAAFDQLKNPGDTTSGLIETTFGYHVEYLIRWVPPVHIPFAEAVGKLRSGIFPDYQKYAFKKFVDDAMTRHRIETHPERLPR